jgi:hypothetical protein
MDSKWLVTGWSWASNRAPGELAKQCPREQRRGRIDVMAHIVAGRSAKGGLMGASD